MKYTIIDCTGHEVTCNTLKKVYDFIKSDIIDLLESDLSLEKTFDADRIYADLQEFFDSGCDPQKIPWIKEGDCWLSDLYTVYQEVQLL